MNKMIKEFENAIVAAINASQLPATIVRIVLEKILMQVIDLETKQLQQEEEQHGAEG